MKKQVLIAILTVAIPALFVNGCTKANEEDLTKIPGGDSSVCDTVNMKYVEDVVPILQENCYGCHGVGNTGGSGGILLEGYSNLKVYAENGQLVGNITHAPGYIGMPYGQPKMDDCSINKIIDWVNQGSPDN
jgi:hypothetical protein